MSRSLPLGSRGIELSELGRSFFYPVFAGIRVGLLVWLFWTFGAGFPPVLLPFTVGSFALLVLAERWIPYRSDWTTRGDPQLGNDLGHSAAYVVISGPVMRGLLLATVAMLAGGGARLWPGVWPDAWPFALQVVLVIALDDLFEYWLHRLTHTTSWLWVLHVLHHTPDRLHVLKTLRHHFLFAWLRGVAVVVPVVALGAPLEVAAWGPAAVFIFGPLSHANIDARLPSWVHRVINTPDVHRIHHSIDPGATASNFCAVFPIWDILFGTYRAPEHETVVSTGLRDDPVPAGFWQQVALPVTWQRR